jgi:hypothetical protein
MHRAQASRTRITNEEGRDTGMAMVLLLLILYVRFRRESLLLGALALQILAMTVPQVFSRVAVGWLGLSHVLGTVMSKILLAAAFFLVVTPIGVLRRVLGKDSLRLRAFKAGDESVMRPRNHTFSGSDIDTPY